jgi:CubicO group peptidase (beta-lactamase class C family)
MKRIHISYKSRMYTPHKEIDVYLRSICLAVAIFAAAAPAPAQRGDSAAAVMERLFARAVYPDSTGCAAGVMRDGALVYAAGYGTANLEQPARITPATVFNLASMSKQFTAMAVLLLARDGRVSLDDDVRRYVPEVPDLGSRITLRHLMHHTSGLRDMWDMLGFSGRRTDDVVTRDDVLSWVSRQEALNFAPGERHLYNNTGYILLGIVVERVSGMPLADFAHRRIFGPLGMAHTRFIHDHSTVVPGRATGYGYGRDGRLHVRMPANDVGVLVSTLEDLARWDANLVDGATVGGPSVVARMRAPGVLNDGSPVAYGGGLMLGEYSGERIEEHGGVDPGYFVELLRFPARRLSVAVLCNGRIDAIMAARTIGGPVAAAAPAPGTTNAPRLADAQAARYAGLYYNEWGDLLRRIVARDGAIYYSRRPGSEDRMVALGGGRFLVPSPAARIEVAFDTTVRGGRPVMRVSVNGARPSLYQPVEPASGLPARLAEYSGTYYSRELRATYLIGVLDGELHWRLAGLPQSEFSVTFPPRFQDDFGEGGVSLHFLRDASGRVTALLLSTERAQRIRFGRR